MDGQALYLTMRLAGTATLCLLVCAIPLAYWIARRHGILQNLVQALVTLPLVLPPTVIGFYLLVALGPRTAIGRALIHLLGHPLAFSFSGLLVGSMLYSLPFAVQPLVAGFQAVDPDYAEAAAMLGERPSRTFWRITLPLARPAVLSAAVLTLLHTVGEFGVVLMLGGNIPGVTRTLSVSLFDLVEDGRYAEANLTAGLLVAVSALGLVLLYSRRNGRLLA